MQQSEQARRPGLAQIRQWLVALLIVAVAVAAAVPMQAASPVAVEQEGSDEPAISDVTAVPAWLEPRGVNVTDLVGVAPESMLSDSMVVYSGGNALAYYQSGSRSGNTVTVTVRFVSKDNRGATCLGMPGDFDTWPTVMPAGTLRIMAGSTNVTRNIVPSFELIPAGQIQPVRNTGDSNGRYQRTTATAKFDSNGALILPANMGCKLFLTSGSTPLTGVFTMQTPRLINATLLGSESLQFRSYIGPGYSGQLESLQQQMISRYGNRHDDLRINPPAGAEFVWVKYPHTPVAAWDPASPAGGTYRIRRSNQKLSVDHMNSMAIPLYGQFQDADQSPGTKFLPYFTDSIAVSSPEYFVPTGVAYNACMTNGGCPASLLETINNARMPMTVYYLSITRAQSGLAQAPLRQIGPAWSPGQQPFAQRSTEIMDVEGASVAAPEMADQQAALFFPIARRAVQLEPDNPSANCPCGWFAADGRMLDLVQPR